MSYIIMRLQKVSPYTLGVWVIHIERVNYIYINVHEY
jgi:hypothetical protein